MSPLESACIARCKVASITKTNRKGLTYTVTCDDELASLLAKCSAVIGDRNGYVQVVVNGYQMPLARRVWELKRGNPPNRITYINGDFLDCRLANLEDYDKHMVTPSVRLERTDEVTEFEDIGRAFGVSKQRAHQFERTALEHFRKQLLKMYPKVNWEDEL